MSRNLCSRKVDFMSSTGIPIDSCYSCYNQFPLYRFRCLRTHSKFKWNERQFEKWQVWRLTSSKLLRLQEHVPVTNERLCSAVKQKLAGTERVRRAVLLHYNVLLLSGGSECRVYRCKNSRGTDWTPHTKGYGFFCSLNKRLKMNKQYWDWSVRSYA